MSGSGWRSGRLFVLPRWLLFCCRTIVANESRLRSLSLLVGFLLIWIVDLHYCRLSFLVFGLDSLGLSQPD